MILPGHSQRSAITHSAHSGLLALLKRVPRPFLKDAHHWLILHGRYTCKARKPLCAECVIADLCEWPGRIIGVR